MKKTSSLATPLTGRASLLCATLLIAGCALNPAPTETVLAKVHEPFRLTEAESVRTGRLDNGLLYVIDQTEHRATTVEFRLKVNVGSLDEKPEESGLAHFIEHMAFNGTRNYPGQALIEYLESTGMSFGHDVNAYTAFDETVYKLSVPANQPDLVDEAYVVLADWAGGILFDPEEVEAEKGVIVEEWRLNYSGEARAWLQKIRTLYGDSDYWQLPIGSMAVVQAATAEDLRALYERTYRADQMTLYISGPVDFDQARELIATHFAPLLASDGYRPNRPVINHRPGQFWLVSDETVSQDYLEHGRLFDQGSGSIYTAQGQRDRFFVEMLRLALQERGQHWHSTSNSGVRTEAYSYPLEDGTLAVELTVFPQGDLTLEHLGRAEQLWQSLLQQGISAEEYDIYSKRLYQQWSRRSSRLNNATPVERIDWFKTAIEDGMGAISWQVFPYAVEALSSHYQAADFNAWLSSDVSDLPWYSGATLTPASRPGWQLSELTDTVQHVARVTAPSVTIEFSQTDVLVFNEMPGEVLSVTETDIENLTLIELANGLPVWFYQSEVEPNRVIVNLVNRGGSASRSYENAALGLFWQHILNETRPQGVSQSAFADLLNDLKIDGSAYDNLLESGLYWDGVTEALPSLMAITAHFMQPLSLNATSVDEYIAGTDAFLRSLAETPHGRIEAALHPYVRPHPNLLNLTLNDLQLISIGALERFHADWLIQGLGVELLVVGDAELESVVEAAQASLAGVALPEPRGGQISPLQWRGASRLYVPAHGDDRVDLTLRLLAPKPIWDQSERWLGNVALTLLENQLMQTLRERQGDTYSVWTIPEQASPQLPQSAWIIGTSTGPERRDAVVNMIEETLADPEDWLTQASLDAVKRQLVENHRRSLSSLDERLRSLTFYTRADRTLADMDRYEATINRYTLADVHRTLDFWAAVQDRLLVIAEPF